VLVKVLPEKEETLSSYAEWEIQRIRGHRAKFPNFFYPRPGWTLSAGHFEFCQRVSFSGSGELNVPVRPVSDPSGKTKLARCFQHVPAKSHTLHTSPNFEMYAVHPVLSADSQ
jgi:hypothetical protein